MTEHEEVTIQIKQKRITTLMMIAPAMTLQVLLQVTMTESSHQSLLYYINRIYYSGMHYGNIQDAFVQPTPW